MGTSITYKKKCEHCKKAFTAQKRNTRFCSLRCASIAYKRNYRAKAKIEKETPIPIEQNAIVHSELENIQKLEFLTVKQAGILLSMSKLAIYRLIQQGKLPAVKLTIRNTRIHKDDIIQLFKDHDKNNPKPIKPITTINSSSSMDEDDSPNRTNYYTIGEVIHKFGISNSALYSLIIKNKIKKIKQGKFTLVSKKVIDELLKDVNHA